MPINQEQFWGSNAKECVTYPINVNVAIIIDIVITICYSDFQQNL